jgi:hypothetical protein
MSADTADFDRHLREAFAALAVRPATGHATFGSAAARDGGAAPSALRLAVAHATFAKGRVKGFWTEALHPRGRNVPDLRGRINRGEFRKKFQGEEVAREGQGPKGKGPTPPRARSPLSGVSQAAYDRAKARATKRVARAAAKGERRLRQFADKAEDDLRALIKNLKAAGDQPLKGGLDDAHGFLYAMLVLQARQARAALADLAGRAAPPAGGGEVRQPVERGPAPKVVRRLMRFTSAAVRRRVLRGLRTEREFSEAIGGHNLPDSEPADALWMMGPGGEIVTDPEHIRAHMRLREDAVRRLSRLAEGPEADRLREFLSVPLHLFEIKTLVTQSGPGSVHMSKQARARKERWEARYAAPFHTIAVDLRRGRKHSGHTVYYKPGVGSARLSDMEKVGGFDEALSRAVSARASLL